MTFTAPPGEINVVRFSADPGATLVEDLGAPLTAGPGCNQVDAAHVSCPWGQGEVAFVANLGDGDDSLVMDPSVTTAPSGGTIFLDGGDGADVMTGSDAVENISGGFGDDVILGAAGDDTVEGGPGDDQITGGFGADHVTGGDGADPLDATITRDPVFGATEGTDTLDGGAGDDELEPGLDVEADVLIGATAATRSLTACGRHRSRRPSVRPGRRRTPSAATSRSSSAAPSRTR